MTSSGEGPNGDPPASTGGTEPRIVDPDELATGFHHALAGVEFPAGRSDLLDAARTSGAAPEVVGLLEGLGDTAPFASAGDAWAEAAGPDGS